MNKTTEGVNNIKMLKLYSWIDLFLKEIKQRRDEELGVLWKISIVRIIDTTAIYLLPPLLSIITYATYIGVGNNLSLEVAFTTNLFFMMIEQPLRTLPYFISEAVELQISMKRIQEFLLCDEINTSIV
jgi:ABC-type bacteriocin/lantibiotic exporter with double-glycine peptidase domain